MALQEKSSIVMTAILAIVPLVTLAVVSHIVLALTNLKHGKDHDERDRLISRYRRGA